MDPNINQPAVTNPIQQPTAPQPVATPPGEPAAPKKGMGKGIILMVILLLLVIGIIAYILFARAQINNSQKAVTDNTSAVLPTPTLVPTLAPEEDLEVDNPEADLLELDADVKGL